MAGRNVLLVEGASDQKFFKQLLSELENSPEIEPKIPRDVDAQIYRNGLQPLYRQLVLQLGLLIRGQINKLGVIVDADHIAQANNGFISRRAQLVDLLAENDFVITPAPETASQGEVFKHPSGAEVGIWIMPDHQSDGMIEDLFMDSVKAEQQPLLTHATDVIGNLGEHKTFAPHHESKARLSTWLAWQQEPGISPSYAYYKGLFDKESTGFIALFDWLKRVFD
uniref:DUF4435 domain-containing protein n=1 Tax=uncultured Thiotrichaceae bacterium TaxID=298394 RepID=A0A6S6TWV2_9GAMM|nr:MAG: Unknown protein [uncultured Thiotrichaceae bacterium]